MEIDWSRDGGIATRNLETIKFTSPVEGLSLLDMKFLRIKRWKEDDILCE